MKNHYKKFIFMSCFTIFGLIALYMTAYKYQLGSHVKASWWIKNAYDVKDYISYSIKEPKIIIASGSNCLFGINGSIIEEITGFKVSNLAAHALLETSFLYYKIKKQLNNGDIVVLPLEFIHYSKDEIEFWFSNNMMAWGQECYLSSLSPFEQFDFILSVPEMRVYEGLLQKKRKNLYLSKKDAIKQFELISSSKQNQWNGYSFRSFDRYGGINVNEDTEKKLMRQYKKGITYIEEDIEISDTFLAFYFKLKDLIEYRGGELILTWPVTIRNKFFDLRRPEHQKKIMKFKDRLKKKSIDIYFNPALFNLDIKLFFNTKYHPNLYGSAIRSKNLANCINNMVRYNNCDGIDFKRAVEIVKREEVQIFEKRRETKTDNHKEKLNNYEIVMRDLNRIKVALEKYFADNKKYPISIGFDGLFTRYGKSGREWIPGVVPKYLDALPRDPRKSEDGGKQYLYKSDGKDYKLISNAAENCKDVVEFNPMLLDPRRRCWAYGYWTKGAKHW